MVEHVSTGARHAAQPINTVGAGGWRDAEFGGDLPAADRPRTDFSPI
jgi:hypothetical protein